MYPEETRGLAVEAVRLGFSLAEAAELAGCSKSAAAAWARAAGVSRPRPGNPVYLPFERKVEIAARRAAGEAGAALAAEFGVSEAAVSAWSRAYREEGALALMTDDEARALAPEPAEPPSELEALRARCEELELENAILAGTVEILKKGPGADPSALTAAERAALAESLRAEFGLARVLGALSLPRSTYHYHASRAAADRDAALRPLVREAFGAGRGAYGYRRVHAELRRRGVRVSEKVVRRVMREEGLEARRPRRKRHSSYAGEPDGRPANVPRERAAARRAAGEDFPADHDFSAAAPGEAAATDVTEFALDGYRCYLSPVIDLFDGMPASWRLSLRPDSGLCDGSLLDWLEGLPEGSSPFLHTDGGGPYRSASWKRICSAAGVERSMSRKGASGDNAPAEGFFGILKTEFFEGRDWSGVGFAEFSAELASYMDWYREGRLKRFRAQDGSWSYETIAGRRRRLGLPV